MLLYRYYPRTYKKKVTHFEKCFKLRKFKSAFHGFFLTYYIYSNNHIFCCSDRVKSMWSLSNQNNASGYPNIFNIQACYNVDIYFVTKLCISLERQEHGITVYSIPCTAFMLWLSYSRHFSPFMTPVKRLSSYKTEEKLYCLILIIKNYALNVTIQAIFIHVTMFWAVRYFRSSIFLCTKLKFPSP